jgi:acyl transferase domain-containing protein/NADPH:quinone reductase-like Zn-dependent oxidoreductase/aryl carrier-like protein
MDPQQRLLLEVVYEALENAGITLSEINGSKTSVFCGCFTKDYDMMVAKDWDMYPKHTVTGTGGAILANRISYFYNLHGTSVTIDTACSSSLVCLHLGRQSILNGESDMSIIVGSSLHFDPREYILMTDLGMLSADGRSRAFDADASGYVRGEGICAVILKRQTAALQGGDNIRAVIRASGTNHDGKTQGITLPSPEAQEALIRSTYVEAGLDFTDTQYFEAHGTGTQAGDPRETSAIGAVFAPGREQPLYVGSVKTNIGHLEGSSGLAGIIKTTLALEHHQIPPNMLFEKPNPKIDFEKWKLAVPTKLGDWQTTNGMRRASINSFGYGGTNAHVVLEEYRSPARDEIRLFGSSEADDDVSEDAGRPYLLPITSHTAKTGEKLEKALRAYLVSNEEVALSDLTCSLSSKRTFHGQRSFVVAGDVEDALDQLDQKRPNAPWVSSNQNPPRLGFIFTGQGAQWYAMGRQLINSCPLFHQSIKHCDRVLSQLRDAPSWSVMDELLKSKDASLLGNTEYSQPLCTALQLALIDLLTSWGIKPTAVVGHSSGEMGAAYAAGILSFENALIAAYYRGLYMSAPTDNSVRGAMMAVGMSETGARAELEQHSGKIAIAAINSPTTMTLSGDEDAILLLKDSLTERKVFARQLQVTQAFHSHHMLPLAPAYEAALNSLPNFKTQNPTCRMVSSVTGRLANPAFMGAAYWAENMTNMVRFSQALSGILQDEEGQDLIDVLVEIGPHPALKGPVRQVQQPLGLNKPYFASLARGAPDYEAILTLAGQLFSLGYPVDLEAVNSNGNPKRASGKRLLHMPSYQWDHKRYWAETRFTKELRLRSSRHAILGAPVPGSFANHPRYRNRIVLGEHPWLSDHVIDGRVIFPGAGYISMAIEAVALQLPLSAEVRAIVLKDIVIKAALMLPETDTGVEIMLELRPESVSAKAFSDRWFEFMVCSYDAEDRCIEHCHGRIAVEQGEDMVFSIAEKFEPSSELLKKTDQSESATSFYRRLNALGLQYGHKFSLLAGSVDRGNGFAMANLDFDPTILPQEPYEMTILHPTLLDASFHVGFSAIESCLGRQLREPYVPTFIEKLIISGSFLTTRNSPAKQDMQICVSTKLPSRRVAISDFLLRSRDSETPLLEIHGLEVTSLGREGADEEGRSVFFSQQWMPAFDMLQSDHDVPALKSIEDLVELYTHQHPNAQVLHISPSPRHTSTLVCKLGLGTENRRRIGHIDVILPDDIQNIDRERLEQFGNNLLTVGQPRENAYDLVVVSANSDVTLSNYLKEDGTVIFDKATTDAPPGLKQQLRSDKFSIFKKFDEVLTPLEDIAIILPSTSMSERAQAIFAAISSKYAGQVTPTTWDIFEETVGLTNTFVILSSLVEPFANDKTFKGAQKLLTGINRNIVWLTEGATMDCTQPESAWVLGLLRSARSENDAIRAVLLDCDPVGQPQEVAARIGQTLEVSMHEEELAERKGCVYVPRIVADDGRNAKLQNGAPSRPRQRLLNTNESLKLEIGQFGVLDSLRLAHDENVNQPLAPNEVEMQVKATSVNSRDIDVCMGSIDNEALGGDCAGVVTRVGSDVPLLSFKPGDRVVAWMPGAGCHRTIVRAPKSACVVLPDFVSFPEAASLSQGLVSAYYGLIELARIQPEETVLIHCAASGPGQIALQLAKRAGAQILGTVGSETEINLLTTKYGLEIGNMFSSRDTTFASSVMARTAGKGVDVILSTFTGQLLQASVQCLAPFGRFIDLCGSDAVEDTRLGLRCLHKNAMFASVDLVSIPQNPKLTTRLLQNVFRLVAEGHIKPPSDIIEVSYANVTHGFRLMQKSDGIRSIVLTPKNGEQISVLLAKFNNQPLFRPNKTYLLVGGLGGLGRSMAEWMYRRGARKISFLSRSGAKRPEAQATVSWLTSRNVEVSVFSGDVSSLIDVMSCIRQIRPSLAGIFHAAMVLQDTPLDKMSFEQWQTCFTPKATGAQNLHLSTLNLQLDFFVCFSSVAAVLGSKAQANYSAANSFLDAFMRYRRGLGLCGTAMNVGAVGGIGVIAENEALQKVMGRLGMDMIDEEELLYQLEEAVSSKGTASVSGIDEHSVITGISLTRADVEWASKPLLQNLYANHDFANSGATTKGDGQSLSVLLAAAADPKSKTRVLVDGLVDKMAVVLGTSKEDVDAKKSLGDYGLDSIVAVEFRKWFRNVVGVDMALFDILGSGSIEALCGKAVALIG